MDEVIKQEWVEALRSGDFPQGQGSLASNWGFCCLGVLCELAVRAGLLSRDDSISQVPYCYRATDSDADESHRVLPKVVLKWAGLESVDPELEYKGKRWTLSLLNDGERLSLSEIADVIEECL